MTGGNLRGPEFDLIAQSARSAGARLRFFRLCYGSPGHDRVSAKEIRAILAGFSPEGRVSVNWEPSDDLLRVQARMICLGLQCLETALAGPGAISVELSEAGTELIAKGKNIRFDSGLWAYVDVDLGLGDAISGKQVQFLLLGQVLAETGIRATIVDDCGADRIELRFDPMS